MCRTFIKWRTQNLDIFFNKTNNWKNAVYVFLFDSCYAQRMIENFRFVFFLVLLEKSFEQTFRNFFVNLGTLSQRPRKSGWVDPIQIYN